MTIVLWDWLEFAVRWVHVITGIAWIGSSFYFIALDLGLRKADHLPDGVGGEAWQVHGGGFYRMQKYLVAPPELPSHLTWFKWESYSSWLSGFALLAIVYYLGAELYLIDRSVLDVPVWGAVVISLVGLSAGWIFYDLLCRSGLGKNDNALFAVLFVFVVAAGWGFTQVFSGRGTYVHIGALVATIMTANVFFIIIPNQKIVVADLIAGRTPDPKLGSEAKQRSLHNNYLTLPVLFLMISTHYPLAFATRWNWVIAALVLLIGAIIRHFFNSMHAGKGKPWWTWGLAAALFAVIVWLSTFFDHRPDADDASMASLDPMAAASPAFVEARDVVLTRCSMCHAREPLWAGLAVAPKGVLLESDADIVRQARAIELQAVHSRAMPPGNITEITAEERQVLAAWLGIAGQ
jgi:uncharacterized membrane protein